MKTVKKQFQRILSIYPTSKGFGFVVMERGKRLIDWGTTRARMPKSKKNRECVKRAEKLLDEYQPDAVILPEADDPKRCQRIKNLIQQIAKMAKARGNHVATVNREQVQRSFAFYGATTKYEIAKVIVDWYTPLKPMLPRPRRPWESEDGRLGVFMSFALQEHLKKYVNYD